MSNVARPTQFYRRKWIKNNARFKRLGVFSISAGREFNSVEELLAECGETAVKQFKEWVFLEEKEWVLTNGNDWLASFTTLDKLPKRTTYRC